MTPHIESLKEQIAEIVIMPGDPLRAKYIAENFLKEAKLVNSIRNMYAYTGTYKGKRLTVMASGMGIPSMGIYSYELYNFYDVKTIIRIGTMGAYSKDLNLLDVILVKNSYSKSQYAKIAYDNNDELIPSSVELNDRIMRQANNKNIEIHVGNILCSEVFYCKEKSFENPSQYDCLGVEMESFPLFVNAKQAGKNAACILTVSDIVGAPEKGELSPEDRQNSLDKMILLALDTCLEL